VVAAVDVLVGRWREELGLVLCCGGGSGMCGG
jgi:hypothetical protein